MSPLLEIRDGSTQIGPFLVVKLSTGRKDITKEYAWDSYRTHFSPVVLGPVGVRQKVDAAAKRVNFLLVEVHTVFVEEDTCAVNHDCCPVEAPTRRSKGPVSFLEASVCKGAASAVDDSFDGVLGLTISLRDSDGGFAVDPPEHFGSLD